MWKEVNSCFKNKIEKSELAVHRCVLWMRFIKDKIRQYRKTNYVCKEVSKMWCCAVWKEVLKMFSSSYKKHNLLKIGKPHLWEGEQVIEVFL